MPPSCTVVCLPLCRDEGPDGGLLRSSQPAASSPELSAQPREEHRRLCATGPRPQGSRVLGLGCPIHAAAWWCLGLLHTGEVEAREFALLVLG